MRCADDHRLPARRARAVDARAPWATGVRARAAPAGARLARLGVLAVVGTLGAMAGLGGLGAVGCGGVEVTFELLAGADLIAPPEALRLELLPQGGEPLSYGPLPTAAVGEQVAAIPPGVPFLVDVIGCPDLDPERCVEPTDFVARGCGGPFNRGRDDVLRIQITLFGPVTGNDRCPPTFDASAASAAQAASAEQ